MLDQRIRFRLSNCGIGSRDAYIKDDYGLVNKKECKKGHGLVNIESSKLAVV